MDATQIAVLDERRDADGAPILIALFVFLAYYLGAKLGFALTFQPQPISVLWPPNAILLAGLLLTPTRFWWLPILGALPAHVLVQLQGGVPVAMIAAWFASNCSEALIGAAGIRLLARGSFHFQSLRNLSIFVGFGVLLGPFLSSFIDAAFVTLVGWGTGGYWDLWRTRFCSNALAALTIVPVIVTWGGMRMQTLVAAPLEKHLEAAALTVAIASIAVVLLKADRVAGVDLALALAPVPLLIWAALRFGLAGTSAAVLSIALVAIWGAAHGHGPFAAAFPMASANAVQLYLSLMAIPLLALSVVLAERRAAEQQLAEKCEELQVTLGISRIGTWQWNIAEHKGSCSVESARIFGCDWIRGEMTVEIFADLAHPADRDRVRHAIEQAIRDRAPYDVEFRVPQRDGSVRWIASRAR